MTFVVSEQSVEDRLTASGAFGFMITLTIFPVFAVGVCAGKLTGIAQKMTGLNIFS